jgi:hypothetical protein
MSWYDLSFAFLPTQVLIKKHLAHFQMKVNTFQSFSLDILLNVLQISLTPPFLEISVLVVYGLHPGAKTYKLTLDISLPIAQYQGQQYLSYQIELSNSHSPTMIFIEFSLRRATSLSRPTYSMENKFIKHQLHAVQYIRLRRFPLMCPSVVFFCTD